MPYGGHPYGGVGYAGANPGAIPDDGTAPLPIPKFHSGGVVPGAPGTEMRAMLQAGETVVPRGGGAGISVCYEAAS